MHLSLSLNQAQRFEQRLQLQVSTSVTLTVFPMSERWLAETVDHQRATKKVAGKCKSENFRSLVDFLFANVFPDCYWFVMDFYADEAPPLREILSREQCLMIDKILIEALKIAYQDFCEDRERSWGKIRKISDKRYFCSAG